MSDSIGQVADAGVSAFPLSVPSASADACAGMYQTGPMASSDFSVDGRRRLEEFAYAFGHAPESYDLTGAASSILRTPDNETYFHVFADRKFWHIPGSIIGDDCHKPQAVEWLKNEALRQGRTVAVYSVTTEESSLFRAAGFAVNKFGEEPMIDLVDLDWQGKSFEWVRRQTNFCHRQGLEVIEITSYEQQRTIASDLLDVFFDDLKDRVYSEPLRLLEGRFDPLALGRRRLFVARQHVGGRTEGFLVASPTENGTSWAFETYRKRRDAVRGTIPFLFRDVIDRLRAENVKRISLCLVPGKGVQQDLASEADSRVRWMLGLWYGRLNVLFSASGQDFFKSRFRPRYQDRYLCVYPHNSWCSILSFVRTSGALRMNLRNLLKKLVIPGTRAARRPKDAS